MYALMNKLATLGLFAGGLANTFGDTGDELTASGTTQADAYESNTGILRFTTVAAGTGVKLDNGSKGDCQLIINDGAETLNVYPPSDQQIEGMGLNTAVTLAPGEAGAFYRITTGRWTITRGIGNFLAQVSSYAQLRSYRGPALAILVASPLGIGGVFARDASDLASADNGGTIIVSGTVRWKRIFAGAVQLQWFQPTGNGVADDTTPLLNAIAAGNIIEGQDKTKVYRVTAQISLTDKHFDMKGATILYDGPTNAFAMVVNAPTGINGRSVTRNFLLDYTGTDTVNRTHGICLGGGCGVVDNIRIEGFTGISMALGSGLDSYTGVTLPASAQCYYWDISSVNVSSTAGWMFVIRQANNANYFSNLSTFPFNGFNTAPPRVANCIDEIVIGGTGNTFERCSFEGSPSNRVALFLATAQQNQFLGITYVEFNVSWATPPYPRFEAQSGSSSNRLHARHSHSAVVPISDLGTANDICVEAGFSVNGSQVYPPAGGINLVRNGRFDNEGVNWSNFSTGGVTVSYGTGYLSGRSQRLDLVAGRPNMLQDMVATGKYSLAALRDQNVTVTAFVRTNLTGISVKVAGLTQNQVPNDGAWFPFVSTIKVPTAATSVSVQLISEASGLTGFVEWSDVCLTLGNAGNAVGVPEHAVVLTDYTALRAYAGPALELQICGYSGTAAPAGIAGRFVRDDADVTTADNGGTVIVASNGKRWKRVFDGQTNVRWFGAIGNGVTDDTAAIQAAIAASEGRVLFFPSGKYRFSSRLDFGNVGIEGESQRGTVAAFNGVEFAFYGAGYAMTIACYRGQSYRKFLLQSYAAGQHGLCITGTSPIVEEIRIEGFDGVGCRVGTGTQSTIYPHPTGMAAAGCYYALFNNFYISNTTAVGVNATCGLFNDGGLPSANGNTYRNCVVNGRFDILYVLNGTNNSFYGGDCDPSNTTATCTAAFKIGGTNIRVHEPYYEMDAPTYAYWFDSNSFACEVVDQHFQNATIKNLDSKILDEGWANNVKFLPVGFNYPFPQQNKSRQNLIANSHFTSWDTTNVCPMNWYVNGGVFSRDSATVRGAKYSLTATAAASAFNIAHAVVSANTNHRSPNQITAADVQGRTFVAAVWAKTSVAGMGNIKVHDGVTAYGNNSHSGGGGWELLTAIGRADSAATTLRIELRNAPSGNSTGQVWFSEPILLFGIDLTKEEPRPLTDTIAQLYGPLLLAPFQTFADLDTTPDVTDLNFAKATNSGATTITNFDLTGTPVPKNTRILYLQSTNGNTTVANNANIATTTGANKLLTANVIYKFLYDGTKWYEF